MKTETQKITDARSQGTFRSITIEHRGNVSWKRTFEGEGIRTLKVDTHVGGVWVEMVLRETHIPAESDKRVTVKETMLTLTRDSALALRDHLNSMIDGEAK